MSTKTFIISFFLISILMIVIYFVYGSIYSAAGMGIFLGVIFLIQGIWANLRVANYQNLLKFLLGFFFLTLLCSGAWLILTKFAVNLKTR